MPPPSVLVRKLEGPQHQIPPPAFSVRSRSLQNDKEVLAASRTRLKNEILKITYIIRRLVQGPG